MAIKRILQFVAILALCLSSACAPKGGGGSDALRLRQPQPNGDADVALGIGNLTFNNSRARCSFITLEEGTRYSVTCRATVMEESGNEAPATGLAEGVTISWEKPKVDATVTDPPKCVRLDLELTQQCEIRKESNAIANLEFSLHVSDKGTALDKFEVEKLQLPLSVRTYGGVPQIRPLIPPTEAIPTEGERVGYQIPEFQQILFDTSLVSTCVPKPGRVYFNTPNHVFYRQAGSGVMLYAGSGNQANVDELSHRLRIALGTRQDSSTSNEGGQLLCAEDRVYLADTNNGRILMFRDDGPVVVVASGPKVKRPAGLAMDKLGNLYFADRSKHIVGKVTPSGEITIFAGHWGSAGSTGDGGPATSALLDGPYSVAVGPDGSVYISENMGHRIRKVAPDGTTSTIANLTHPFGIAVAPNGALYVLSEFRIWEMTSSGPVTFMGTGVGGYSGDLSPPIATQINTTRYFSINWRGDFYIADNLNRIVRVVRKSKTGIDRVSTEAGTPSDLDTYAPPEEEGVAAFLRGVSSVALNSQGSVLFNDPKFHRVRSGDPDGKIRWVAGNGIAGLPNNDAPALETPVDNISDLSMDHNDIFAASSVAQRIYRISNGLIRYYVSGVPVLRIASGPNHSVYFTHREYSCVRKADQSSRVTTVAGDCSLTCGFAGDKGPASSAVFCQPQGLAVSADGTVFVADSGNQRIRAIYPNGTIDTIAGNGTSTFAGDGGPALAGSLSTPRDVSVMSNGTVLVADYGNSRIRALTPNGDYYQISTLIGGTNGTDCGGTSERILSSANLEQEVQTSLSSICLGNPTSVDVKYTCGQPQGKWLIAFSQDFSPYSSVVRIERPCPK